MNREPDREQVRRLFMEIVELPSSQQPEALDLACGVNTALRAEVDALLAADRRAAEFMTGPIGPTPPRPPTPPGERPGDIIGPYQLVQLIGEGGFGTVFMAEQKKPVARTVALKIIKLGMDTRQVIARFEQERQALVILEHPNIARVLDAGATDTGRPYFVMELVRGTPIVEYCDEHRLSVRERLELFAQVCGAIQHAHTKGIIHRDIKPSNVLVTTLDGRPATKIIDFGIAKAIASKLVEKTIFTEERQIIGTPEYMSPEQAGGSFDIDTRTDVYSLGVLLYELLTGSTPLDTRRLRSAAFDEMRRIIREVDPPRPSTRLSQSSATIAGIAATRRTEPRRLGTLVRGELDWIVMQAMEKDRARRYESVGAFASDIQRYLGDEPVLAAPPSTIYRLGKFVRRHRASVLAGSTVTAVLVAGVVAFAWQANIARLERDTARQEAARATANSNFLESMFLAADPQAGGSRDVTIAQLLSKASTIADKTLADQPLVEAHARALLGSTFRSLGKIDEALHELERARLLQEQTGETRTVFMAGTYRKIGSVMMDRKQPLDALSYFQRAHAIILGLRPELPLETIRGHQDIASAQLELSKFADCELSLDQADALVEALPNDPVRIEYRAVILGTRSRLAKAWKNDQAQAESFAERAVAMWRQGGKPALLADALNNLAVMRMEGGKLGEALALYEEALKISRAELGDQHPRIAVLLENCGNIHFRSKELDQAQSLLDQALVIREAVFGNDSMLVARTRYNIAAVALERNNFAHALELIDAVVPVFRNSSGEKSLDYASALRLRAACLKGKGEYNRAIEEFNVALGIFDTLAPPSAPPRLRCLQGLAEAYCSQGLHQEVDRTARLALDVLNAKSPDQARWIATFQDVLAKCRTAPAP